jgi:hypothetical protein
MYGTLLFFMLLTTSALSQTSMIAASAAITGTVHDPSDAAIVGARVASTNELPVPRGSC